MANYVFMRGERCYTAKAEVRYRGPLPIGTAVKLEGRQVRRKGRLAVLEGRVLRADDGEVVAEATGSFMVEAAAGNPAGIENRRPGGFIRRSPRTSQSFRGRNDTVFDWRANVG